jgi:hopanoid biosynthesis associated protein HpnK
MLRQHQGPMELGKNFQRPDMVSPPYSQFPSASTRLIVHADDLGIAENVNEGVLLAHAKGILTSASIMAAGEAFEHAVRICSRTPSLDVGVHLTLTGERPLLPAAEVRSLVDEKGRFHEHATVLAKRYLLGKLRLDEVRRELEAQLKKVLSAGIAVSHVDSHQHVHMLPEVFTIVVDLLKKYGIPAVRVPREQLRWKLFWQSRSIVRSMQLLVLNAFCDRVSKDASAVVRTQYFAGFLFGGNLTPSNLRFLLDNMPGSGWCELMCHPGLDDPQSRYRHWGYHWAAELEALVHPDSRDLLRRRGIALISYRDLARARAGSAPTALRERT